MTPKGETIYRSATDLNSRARNRCITGDTLLGMNSISVRELRNNGASTLDRVSRGESLIVTRDGVEVATLVPRERSRVSSQELIERRRTLPPVDPRALRTDLDSLLDPSL